MLKKLLWFQVSLSIGVIILGILTAIAWRVMIWMPGENPSTSAETHTELQALSKQLERDVRWLSESFLPRSSGKPENLAYAAQYIAQRFEENGYDKVERQSYEVQGATYHNVWVHNQKEAPKKEVVVVGAHYDAFQKSPGANDNASGVAALLHLAKKIGAQNLQTPFIFVALANEEPPHFGTAAQGARQFAHFLAQNGTHVKAMVSLETLGFYTDRAGSQRYPAPLDMAYPHTGNFLGVVGNLSSRSLVNAAVTAFRATQLMPAEGASLPSFVEGVGWSDHAAFWEWGIPAIMITDTAPFRYPYYHTAADTADKLDYHRFGLATIGIESVLIAVANAQL